MRRFLAALLSVTIAGGCATTKQPIESEETIAAQEARVRALKTDVSTLTRTGETLDREIVALEKRIAWRDEAIERLSKDINDTRVLDEQLRRFRAVVDAYARRYASSHWFGNVVGVSPPGAVEISLGRTGGVRRGDDLQISRGGHYVGRITIVEVGPGYARGLPDTRWIGEAWPPRPGDDVWAGN